MGEMWSLEPPFWLQARGLNICSARADGEHRSVETVRDGLAQRLTDD